jgi:hypothetical protein
MARKSGTSVTRLEFDRLRKAVEHLADLVQRSLPAVEQNARDHAAQGERIDRIQAELDEIKKARQRITAT